MKIFFILIVFLILLFFMFFIFKKEIANFFSKPTSHLVNIDNEEEMFNGMESVYD